MDSSSFPSSAWERTSAKLRFASPRDEFVLHPINPREAELPGDAFPSGAWEQGPAVPFLMIKNKLPRINQGPYHVAEAGCAVRSGAHMIERGFSFALIRQARHCRKEQFLDD